MVAQPRIAKNYSTIHFKWVNFMACKLYLNKAKKTQQHKYEAYYIAKYHPKLCYTIGSHRVAGNPCLRGADHTKAMEFFPSGPLLFIGRVRAWS